jgi:hypothetical protein
MHAITDGRVERSLMENKLLKLYGFCGATSSPQRSPNSVNRHKRNSVSADPFWVTKQGIDSATALEDQTSVSLTERLGSYAEGFALVPDGADTNRPQQYFNGGFTYLLTHDIQLDVRAGVGLNEAADDFFVGSGLSVRFR